MIPIGIKRENFEKKFIRDIIKTVAHMYFDTKITLQMVIF